jgi:hypothetical protein
MLVCWYPPCRWWIYVNLACLYHLQYCCNYLICCRLVNHDEPNSKPPRGDGCNSTKFWVNPTWPCQSTCFQYETSPRTVGFVLDQTILQGHWKGNWGMGGMGLSCWIKHIVNYILGTLQRMNDTNGKSTVNVDHFSEQVSSWSCSFTGG